MNDTQEDMVRIVKVRPIGETDWLFLDEEGALIYMREAHPEVLNWEVRFSSMSRENLDSMGEFDGW